LINRMADAVRASATRSNHRLVDRAVSGGDTICLNWLRYLESGNGPILVSFYALDATTWTGMTVDRKFRRNNIAVAQFSLVIRRSGP